MRWTFLAVGLLLLVGCAGEKISPLSSTIDFGEVFIAGTYEDSTPLLNAATSTSTITSVSIDNPAFAYIGATPLAMDGGAPYPMDFAFTATDGEFGTQTATATITVQPGSGDVITATVVMTALFTQGDADGDGVVSTAYGGDDCDDANPLTYLDAEEVCDGQDNDCDDQIGVGEIDQDADGYIPCDGDIIAMDGDCDDIAQDIHPNATELCDGRDTDCDGSLGDEELDGDNDLHTECAGDCEPTNPAVHPGATEVCDGLDTDCSNGGTPPPDESDNDTDGVLECDGDCDDLDALVRPNAPGETCDGKDTNCDGILPLDEQDDDVDGFAVCEGDCDDTDALVRPGQSELCDGLDNDCSGSPNADPQGEVDVDGDGSLSCQDCDDAEPTAFPSNPEVCDGLDNDCDPSTEAAGGEGDGDTDGSPACEDCNDLSPAVFPGNPELCDGLDNDCDPTTDEAVDGDGDGSTTCDGDCFEGEPTVFPGNSEVCDGLDNDCDVTTEAAGGEGDGDGDGSVACADCNDSDGTAYPGAPELCDGVDNDCNGDSAGEEDGDGDGSRGCEDCNDNDAAVFPGAVEACDGLDNDCDAATSASPGEEDLDGDGSPVCADCDDADPFVFPGNPELCDGADNDCDPSTDENVSGDGDPTSVCGGDCDDSDGGVFPGATEICDGADNDCDGSLALGEDADGDGDGTLDCADSTCPHHVDGSFTGSSTGSSAAPWVTLTQGLTQASNGGCTSLWVAAGSYPENLSWPAGGMRLVGTAGASQTTITGTGSGVLVTASGSDVALQGVTLTGGNHVGNGGAITVTGAGLELLDVVISNNACTGAGGGFYVDGGALSAVGATVTGNSAGNNGGGGYVVDGDAEVIDSYFANNLGGGGDGGGLYLRGSSTAPVEVFVAASSFQDNEAFDDGGGLYVQDFFGEIRQCVFSDNSASADHDGWGGGLVTHSTAGLTRIRNNLFVGNASGQGAGVFAFQAEPFFDNNVVADNAAASPSEPSALRLFDGVARNNIVAYNSGIGIDDAGAGTFAYNDVFGNTAGAWLDTDRTGVDGNLALDPLFVAFTDDDQLAGDDFGLQGTSPCIDAGHPGSGFTDPDGSDGDMGAYGGPFGDW